ncbi:hypothetical protein N7468_008439 [Penicillium chermesinum]|uniref:Uncharacterized protein n=1 Tax=Penicillium chermesinum TaxID=63820 RepID=A0A9W9NPU4_9EURO|nr:uncharacterized protein N7468_008439 [Penicillium chermesinum]KAJ5223897.1 hypothetical protein N7468_008439 [Penicillium chermesinum]
MTVPTFALWHGLKAVHFPHPIYLDGKWTAKELGRILNPGPPDRINGDMASIWNFNHMWDHILYRFSYMFTAQTAEDFYRRWLGYKIDPNQYTDGTIHQDPQGRNWFDGGHLLVGLRLIKLTPRASSRGKTFMALYVYPPMLLHPIKNTDLKKGPGMAVPV